MGEQLCGHVTMRVSNREQEPDSCASVSPWLIAVS